MNRGPWRRKSLSSSSSGRLEAPREEAATERRVRDQADPELAQRRQDLRLEVARPERVLGLDSRDRMRRVRLTDPLRRGLAEADVQHLALGDQLAHRPDGLLDRHVRVHAVLVVEVDAVGAEALERALDRAAHVLRAAVAHPGPLAVLVPYRAHPELGGDHVLVPPPGDRLADQLLVRERAVHLRRVEEVDPELRARAGSPRSTRPRRSRRRRRTSPCSQARAPRPRARCRPASSSPSSSAPSSVLCPPTQRRS